jgi:hypothetical protein
MEALQCGDDVQPGDMEPLFPCHQLREVQEKKLAQQLEGLCAHPV